MEEVLLLLFWPIAVFFAIQVWRYSILYAKFRIFEHVLMVSGTIASLFGAIILSLDQPGLIVGGSLLIIGLLLWGKARLEILGNLKWREIRKNHSTKEILLPGIHLDDS